MYFFIFRVEFDCFPVGQSVLSIFRLPFGHRQITGNCRWVDLRASRPIGCPALTSRETFSADWFLSLFHSLYPFFCRQIRQSTVDLSRRKKMSISCPSVGWFRASRPYLAVGYFFNSRYVHEDGRTDARVSISVDDGSQNKRQSIVMSAIENQTKLT